MAVEAGLHGSPAGSPAGPMASMRLSNGNVDSVKKLADHNVVGTAINPHPLKGLTTNGFSGMHSTLRGTQQSNFMIGTQSGIQSRLRNPNHLRSPDQGESQMAQYYIANAFNR